VLADVTGIRVALPAVGAIDVLLTANSMLRDSGMAPYAYLDLHYRDGSQARITINYREHVVPSCKSYDDPGPAHLAYTAVSAPCPVQVFSARFENPQPERELVSVDWIASKELWSDPMLLALTLEARDAPAATNGGP
jgi:hypothetical protein